jgi:septal ring factor EnvC (AmiA/AmiB activator)
LSRVLALVLAPTALLFSLQIQSAAAAETRKPAAPTSPTRAAPPKASNNPSATNREQEQQALRKEQQQLQSELGKLKRQLAATESSRSEATDALAASEIAISKVNRRLRELGDERRRIEKQVAALAARERDVAGRQNAEQRRVDELFRQQQRLSLRDPLLALIAGEDPNGPGRDERYLMYLSRSAQDSISQLQVRRSEIADLQRQSEEKHDVLAKISEDEARSKELLQKEQAARRRAIEQLSKQAAGQRQSIARLERDEQRLATLIDRLTTLLAEQRRKEADAARKRAEREAGATRKAPPAAHAKAGPATGSATSAEGNSGAFAQTRGHLALPVQGSIAARFGAPRKGEGGATLPSSKGIFILAPAGTDVRAVGAGQVVFADWLRGFGNLLVIDHGDGYLSIYGNNESLLRNVGDKIAVGDTVALVGNTGGNEAPGLYFELRFQGRPFDPLTWVAAR